MTDKASVAIVSEIIGTGATYTLDELCQSCSVEADWIVELVEHGVIEPIGQARSDWRFASISVVRVAKAKRLGRDLELSPPGLALVLEPLDQIDKLRSRPESSATTDRMEQ